MISDNDVSIASVIDGTGYPASPPYLPDENYPEFSDCLEVASEKNVNYSLLRQIFLDLGLDKDNFGTPEWNPLSEIIRPGDNVLIKPNLVRHIHMAGGNFESVVTHPSIIRCMLDYVALALKGKGEITVGDAPVQSADFTELAKKNHLNAICESVSKTWKISVKLVDFRLWAIKLDNKHRVLKEDKLNGDAKGYCAVQLGKDSYLQPIIGGCDRFRITSYDSGELQTHHNEERNEYLVPNTVVEADVVINLPKLKTHRKVALTAALKNLVGINGHKDWLPHHRFGSIEEGGDEYKNRSRLKEWNTKIIESIDKNRQSALVPVKRFLLRVIGKLIHFFAADPYREGSWYGNDTVWRMVLDLNRLLIYANKEGIMQDTPQRRCLTIVDGIVAGEGEGPMEPDSRKLGLLVGGKNPVAVDAVLATIIGFDCGKIPIIVKGFLDGRWKLTDFDISSINIVTKDKRWVKQRVGSGNGELCFLPPSGWLKHVECEECLK